MIDNFTSLNALDEKPEKLVDKKCYINMEYIGSA
jgi:hypothetical protein